MPLDDVPVVARDVVAGGISTALVSALLNPVDVLKTRRQVGIERTALAELRFAFEEYGAWRGLWRPGLTSSVIRELLYSGCTKGLYPLARDLVTPENQVPGLPHRLAAAALTGFGGSICANGPDVVKIRFFADPSRYDGFVAGVRHIFRNEGASGFFVRGISASAPRGAAIAIGEVATYDQTKVTLRPYWTNGELSPISHKGKEPFSLHVITSLITGFVATTVAAPFDTLKSRVMLDDGGKYPRGFIDALGSLLRKEGPFALFRGWWPAYCRLGPHSILTFPLIEQMRWLLGLEHI